MSMLTRYGGLMADEIPQCSHISKLSGDFQHRWSAEWVPQEFAGVGTSRIVPYYHEVYKRTVGLLPRYSGHVPGERFRVGKTYGNSTVDAKRWLELHKPRY